MLILSSGNRNILFSILLCVYLPLCVSVSLCLFLSHSLCLLVCLALFLSILLSVAPSPPATQSCVIRFSFRHSTDSACMYARLSVCLAACLPDDPILRAIYCLPLSVLPCGHRPNSPPMQSRLFADGSLPSLPFPSFLPSFLPPPYKIKPGVPPHFRSRCFPDPAFVLRSLRPQNIYGPICANFSLPDYLPSSSPSSFFLLSIPCPLLPLKHSAAENDHPFIGFSVFVCVFVCVFSVSYRLSVCLSVCLSLSFYSSLILSFLLSFVLFGIEILNN